MIAAEKRSNLQPPPEIKFEPNSQLYANFKSLHAQIKANRQSKPKNQNVKFKPSRPSRKQSHDLKVQFAKKLHKIKFLTRKHSKRPSVKIYAAKILNAAQKQRAPTKAPTAKAEAT